MATSWTVAALHFSLRLHANCTASVTNLRSNASSSPEPFLLLYNRVADNHVVDLEPCASLALAGKADGGSQADRSSGSAPVGSFLVAAAHGYGELLVRIKPGGADASYLIFELADTSSWNADPKQTHVVWPRFCPTDMCDSDGKASVATPFVNGVFQGFRGLEGAFPDSVGYYTISSTYMNYNIHMFAKQGEKIAFTLAPTAKLPSIRAQVTASEPSIAPPSPNRAKSWLWAGVTTEATLNDTIATAQELGVELIFFSNLLHQYGDYRVDPVSWPSGLGAARRRVEAAGMSVGMHIISSITEICLHQVVASGPYHCTPAPVVLEHPEVLVPQGAAPSNYYWTTTAGVWFCHMDPGSMPTGSTYDPSLCQDLGRLRYAGVNWGSNKPNPTPPSNPIRLHNITRSKLGRYRGGGALGFNGVSSVGILNHSSEYNFSMNPYITYIKGVTPGWERGWLDVMGFTLQLVASPTQPPSDRLHDDQVLASKGGEWKLLIRGFDRRVEWWVAMSDGWAVATSTTALPTTGDAHVIKATQSAGKVSIFICAVTADYRCNITTTPEGSARGKLPLQLGLSPVFFGAEGRLSGSGGMLLHPYSGAMEEISLQRVSLENITHYLDGDPAAGPINFHLWDYTTEAGRQWWAESTAAMFNEAGAMVSQWDGAELTPLASLWDLPHSKRTFNSGLWSAEYGGTRFKALSGGIQPGPGRLYWPSATLEAFGLSRSLWKQPMAVEFSMLFGGAGPWRSDMSPLGDEGTFGGLSQCLQKSGGPGMHRDLLLSIVQEGTTFNMYNTQLPRFPDIASLDCFVGGLIAIGIPPQFMDVPPATDPKRGAIVARARYWLGVFDEFGQLNETGIHVLNQRPGYPPVYSGVGYSEVFLSRLEGPRGHLRKDFSPHTPCFSLYADAPVTNETVVELPPIFAKSSAAKIIVALPSVNLSVAFSRSTTLTKLSLFAASAHVTLTMQGGAMFSSQTVRETVKFANGSQGSSSILPTGRPVTVSLEIGDRVDYSTSKFEQ